ncbi:hypothetical protein CYMTET_47540 [Cymbomonas tetramitiformis]|uniref:Uncharacterized protein n=1 Tax=Cymbomonas tetramitiformis TaxID=36881 RepID=A0AAE0BV36_9CHLO|nr:hypothetical protein CYMTET_47540 [Cymbomonas tetramitiformis]
MPEWLRPVDKLSDPNHMQKIMYKLLEALRVAEKWKGGILSKAVINYLNRMYRYVIKSVAAKNDREWALPDYRRSRGYKEPTAERPERRGPRLREARQHAAGSTECRRPTARGILVVWG